MFRNYFTIAVRSLLKNKAHAFINIFGLTLGITCCLLIGLFVYDEWTFDTFHSKAGRIYRAYVKEDWGENQQFFNTITPFPLGPALKNNLAEIEEISRLTSTGTQIKVGNDTYRQEVGVVGQSFWKLFDFEFIEGDRNTALGAINDVVLSRAFAERYFGTTDAIGKTLEIQINEVFENFVVKGVMENAPSNSSIQPTVLISDLNFSKLYNERALNSGWFNITPTTFVLLKEGVNKDELEKKFPAVLRSQLGDEDFAKSKFLAGLQPLTSIHLDPSYPLGALPVSNPKYSYILAGVSILLLIVACINFVTLSIGRSISRAKEVGIRKVAGAERFQLVFQFVGEAVTVTLIALALGFVCTQAALPVFNDLSGKELSLRLNGFVILTAALLLLVIGFLAGSYPAFVLSGFKPANIFKGVVSGISSRQNLRKSLVGLQLVLSIFLISSTLVMRNQLEFLQNKDLGFNKEQLVVIQNTVTAGGRLDERMKAGFEKCKQYKTEFTKLANVAGACVASHDFGNGNWTAIGYTDEKGVYREFFMNVVEPDYADVLKMQFVQGRNFSKNNPSDLNSAIVVNEAFAKEMGWTDAVGKRLPGKNFLQHEVIGVIKDFNYASLYTSVQPLVLTINPVIVLAGTENINFDNSPMPKLIVRLKAGVMGETIEQIKSEYEKLSGGQEFVFSFVDDTLAKQYRSDQNLGKIMRYATGIAIVIASLGLYGLAALAMHNRRKEISIRKVLGATEETLLLLLSRDYVLLVLIALTLSVPITILLMQNWLATFEYRVTLTAQVFALSGGISLSIALLTIAYHVVRSAFDKPAQALKYE